MKKIVGFAIEWLVYSNAYVAILLWASLGVFEILTGVKYEWSYYLLTTGGTLFLYTLHRLISVYRVNAEDYKPRHIMVKEFIELQGIVVLLGMTLSLYGWLINPIEIVEPLYLLGVIALFYSVPVIKIKGEWKSLRNAGAAKVGLVAFVFVWVLALPAILYGNDPWFFDGFLIFSQWLFVVAITIPFDIRDIELDRKQFTKTLPISIGGQRTWQVMIFIFLFHMIIVFAGMNLYHFTLPECLALVSVDIIGLYLIFRLRNMEVDYNKAILFEFLLILQFLFLWIVN